MSNQYDNSEPNIEILQEKKEGKVSSFFYEGDIAKCEKGGKTFYLIATGEVKVEIKDRIYANDGRFEAIREENLTDDKLKELAKSNEIRWMNNNWFEVIWVEDGETRSVVGDVAHTYDAGIDLLKQYAKEK